MDSFLPFFVKPSQVQRVVGLSKNTALELEKNGDFPKRVRISKRQTAWRSSDLLEWSKLRKPVELNGFDNERSRK